MTSNPFAGFMPDPELLDGFLKRDDTIPIRGDAAAEARRLAREWKRLADRMHALWPDEAA